MPFGINIANGGEFLPYVKMDGKDGKVSRCFFDGAERITEDIEKFSAIMDFATVQEGWIRFAGRAPDMRLVAIGDPLPDSPGDDYKPGIKMVIQLPNGLGLHELATTASGVIGAIQTLYDEVLATPEWTKGEVPVVRITDWKKEKAPKGIRAIPEFAIVGWKDRPEALKKFKAEPKLGASMPGAAAQAEKPPATGSTPLQPPRPGPKPEPPTVDFDDFG
jgi:hypothetical protein